MANYNNLKAGIDAVIKTNGRQEISGAALNTQLKNMITELGAGYQYMGVATPATNPGTPDANVFYLASEAGTYTNFRGIVINEGEVCALVWNGTWTKQVTGIATAEQLNQLGQEMHKIAAYAETAEDDEIIEVKNGEDSILSITPDKIENNKPTTFTNGIDVSTEDVEGEESMVFKADGDEFLKISDYSVVHTPRREDDGELTINDGNNILISITKDKTIINQDVVINGTLDAGESFEKKIVIEGDSITWGYNPHGERFTYYAQQLAAKLRGVSVYNTGLSDSTITKMPNKPQISSQARMNAVIAQNPDIILLLAGVNDYGTNAPIGNIGDQTDETFSGAMEIIINAYLSALPNVRLIYCTPTPYYYHFVGQSTFHSGRVANAGGNNLRAYAERAIEICKLYSIPVVDTNHDAGWLDTNEVDGAFNFTTDGIHLDEKGYNVLTNLQVSKIKELFNL